MAERQKNESSAKRTRWLLIALGVLVVVGLVTGQTTIGDLLGIGGGSAEDDVTEQTTGGTAVDDGAAADDSSAATGTDPAADDRAGQADGSSTSGKTDDSGTDGDTVTLGGVTVSEDGTYTSKDEVAAYIHAFGHLPDNYVTKDEAIALGWSEGGYEPYAYGKTIGGDHFSNYEGKLPDKRGREWTECDILADGQKKRGVKRIVFSNDGLVYYTDDHYESYEQLY